MQVYAYDASDARIHSSGSSKYYVNGANGQTEAVVDVTNPGIITHNIWGNDLVGQVRRNGSLTRYYHLKDHLGSIRVTVDASGNRVASDDYDPWGMLMDGRSYNAGQADARYKFTGKEKDTETGLDYFGARYYDSRIGRWLSVDPLAEKFPNTNPYNYCLNNPIMIVDPNGLDTLIFSRSGELLDERKSDDEVTYVQDKKGKVSLTKIKGSFSKLDGTQSEWVSYMDAIANGLITAKAGVNPFSLRSDAAKWLADITSKGFSFMITSTDRTRPTGSLHTNWPAQGVDIGRINSRRYSGTGWYDHRYEQATSSLIEAALGTRPSTGYEVIGPNFFFNKTRGSLAGEDFQVQRFKLWKDHLNHVHLGVK